VDGFWSITVYNEDGFMEKNDLDIYSFNGVTAETNADGSSTIPLASADCRSFQVAKSPFSSDRFGAVSGQSG
jgi:hypothetical protein